MSPSNILTGRVWIEHSSGIQFLTLSGTASGALQAAIPIFVTFVGSQLWNVVRLAIWHFYWTRGGNHKRRRSGALHVSHDQRAVIVRNSADAFSLGWSLSKHWWHWRKFFRARDRHESLRFPVVVVLICSFWFAGWIFIGVMVNQIWDPSNQSFDQALLQGRCGNVAFLNTSSPDQQSSLRALNNNYTVMADEYVRRCYVDDISPTASCSYFTQHRINFTEGSGDCPFLGDGTCLSNATPYVLETPYIDSSEVLGINAAKTDRVHFRKRTTCSPVSSKGRTEIVNYTQPIDRQEWPKDTRLYRFFFGSIGGANDNDSYVSDWTYEFPSWKPEHNLQYDTASFGYFGAAPYNIWTPNATFWDASREDADVTLIFLNGDHIVYEYTNNDPLFITGEMLTQSAGGVNSTVWVPEYYTNVLGCIDQYEMCSTNNSSGGCTGMVSSFRLTSEIFTIGLSPVQLETAKRIVRVAAALSTHYAVNGRGPAALQATLSVADTLQTKRMSDKEWCLEAKHWFAQGLAKLQQLTVDYAAAPPNTEIQDVLQEPENAIATAQCSSQRIRLPAGASNFSWLGILIIVFLGAFLWLLGACAEPLLDKLLIISGHEERRLAWIATSPEGLQRLAYRAAGYGNDRMWAREDSSLPLWLPDGPHQPRLKLRNGALFLVPGAKLMQTYSIPVAAGLQIVP